MSTGKLPPDGGWGWIVVGANVVSNMMSLPVTTNFGLIFKDKLSTLAMSATDVSMIININSSCGMLMGLITGPLLKFFGYRKIGAMAGFMFATGITMTAFATTFTHFIVTYSLLAAAGYGLTTSSFSLALNTYFKERRSKAAGITMALTGFGPIIYPPMITYLLSVYGVMGCVLVLGGLSFNIVAVAFLLQPIKYHYITATVDRIETGERYTSVPPDSTDNHRNSQSDHASSMENEDDYLESMHKLEDFSKPEPKAFTTKQVNDKENCQLPENGKSQIPITVEPPKKSPNRLTAMWHWAIAFFDLDLLRDSIFLNIILGMSIATFAEINFSILTPFILNEMKYTTVEIASALSSVAISDIISRFGAPFLGDCLHLSPRVMYMMSLSCLIVARSCYLAVTDFKSLILLSVGLGVAKGIRTVYMVLVIPEYVTIDKLPSANGIRMVANGVMLILLGTIVGHIVDISGSYVKCILFINCVTFVSIAMWTVEMLCVRLSAKKK